MNSLRDSELSPFAKALLSKQTSMNSTKADLNIHDHSLPSTCLAPFNTDNYLKFSPTPTVRKYSKKEFANYFKITAERGHRATYIRSSREYRGIDISGESQLLCDKMLPSPVVTYIEGTGHDAGLETRDLWLSMTLPMYSSKIMPGIPIAYAAEASQGSALYVMGMPPSFSTQGFMNLFNKCGKIDKCPCVIDLNSEETFRWVIMETAKEADIVLATRNGMLLPYKGKTWTVKICKAWPAGNVFVLSETWPLERFFEGDLPVTAATFHSHPPANNSPSSSFDSFAAPKASVTRADIKSESNGDYETTPTQNFVQPVNTAIPNATTSWANVAGNVDTESKTIDLRPESKLRSAASRRQPVGRIPSSNSGRYHEPLIDQARIIFLLELPPNITLTDVSDAIREGPLHTIQFGVNEDTRERFAGIVFQHARDAETFYQVLCKERVDRTPGRFRFIVEARRGEEPFPADDTIQLMGAPTFATRRLTIVKSRFFFVFKEPQLKALCEKEVEPENIQIIWLYNGGNATVIFAKVSDAILVKKKLDSLRDAAEESSHFYALQTTFSKDPCVQDIHYVSDLHD